MEVCSNLNIDKRGYGTLDEVDLHTPVKYVPSCQPEELISTLTTIIDAHAKEATKMKTNSHQPIKKNSKKNSKNQTQNLIQTF